MHSVQALYCNWDCHWDCLRILGIHINFEICKEILKNVMNDYSQAHQAKASSSHIINISAAFYGLSRLSWDLDWHRGRISCTLSAYWPWLCCWGFGQGWRCRIGLIWLKILPFLWRYFRGLLKIPSLADEGISGGGWGYHLLFRKTYDNSSKSCKNYMI